MSFDAQEIENLASNLIKNGLAASNTEAREKAMEILGINKKIIDSKTPTATEQSYGYNVESKEESIESKEEVVNSNDYNLSEEDVNKPLNDLMNQDEQVVGDSTSEINEPVEEVINESVEEKPTVEQANAEVEVTPKESASEPIEEFVSDEIVEESSQESGVTPNESSNDNSASKEDSEKKNSAEEDVDITEIFNFG